MSINHLKKRQFECPSQADVSRIAFFRIINLFSIALLREAEVNFSLGRNTRMDELG